MSLTKHKSRTWRDMLRNIHCHCDDIWDVNAAPWLSPRIHARLVRESTAAPYDGASNSIETWHWRHRKCGENQQKNKLFLFLNKEEMKKVVKCKDDKTWNTCDCGSVLLFSARVCRIWLAMAATIIISGPVKLCNIWCEEKRREEAETMN